jgi:hypothetical protein
MTTLDKAIQLFGFENPITITVAVLEEQGKTDLAERLFEECKELAHPHWCEDDEDEWDEDEEYLNGDEEMGFDPYEGCYTYDC